jgi:aromatic ring-opening dioxygenase LigB subunit
MLSFACITPHPPIAVPTIGRENSKLLPKTIKSLKKLNQIVLAKNLDTIIVISPHGIFSPDCFTANFAETYSGNFENFGDFTTKLSYKGDAEISYRLHSELSSKFPVSLTTDPIIDHGVGVPLYYLASGLTNFSILPITYSALNYKTHFQFGEGLREIILSSNKKIGVIASGDLSHRLSFDAPNGYSPSGRIFDEQLTKYLKRSQTEKIFKLDKEIIDQAGECGLRSIIILLGILNEIKNKPKVLSYECPFGVGYLTMNFELSE